MKYAKVPNLLIASLLLVTVASGCKKNPKNITPIAANSNRVGSRNDLGNPVGAGDTGNSLAAGGTQVNALGQNEIAAGMENANEDRATLASQTVYFEFDRSAIRPSEQSKLDDVAAFLKNTPGVQLKVEGHCDERGTEEYNRSLGERRAIAIREVLIQKHAIESGAITTVSFGEDKPVNLENTEEGYAKNRRGEFVLLRPR